MLGLSVGLGIGTVSVAVVVDNAVKPELTYNFAGPFSFGANAAY